MQIKFFSFSSSVIVVTVCKLCEIRELTVIWNLIAIKHMISDKGV